MGLPANRLTVEDGQPYNNNNSSKFNYKKSYNRVVFHETFV
jgi:hypothetical protein